MKLRTLCQVLDTKRIIIVMGSDQTGIEGDAAQNVAAAAFGDCFVKRVTPIDDDLMIEVETHERGAGENFVRKAHPHIKKETGMSTQNNGVEGAFAQPYSTLPF